MNGYLRLSRHRANPSDSSSISRIISMGAVEVYTYDEKISNENEVIGRDGLT